MPANDRPTIDHYNVRPLVTNSARAFDARLEKDAALDEHRLALRAHLQEPNLKINPMQLTQATIAAIGGAAA